ncbi:MAG: hypothetical protein Q8L30_00160 [bacterium]|nr:hypothetical protein [bacterium]
MILSDINAQKLKVKEAGGRSFVTVGLPGGVKRLYHKPHPEAIKSAPRNAGREDLDRVS